MVDWKDPEVIKISGFVFNQMVVFITGIYGWEFTLTFWFEWLLITRKIDYKWFYTVYLLGRYAMLFTLLSSAIINRMVTEINCAAIHPLIVTSALIAAWCSTTNLMIRTRMIWKHKPIIVIPLRLLSLGHLIFLLTVGITDVKSHWDTEFRMCVVKYENDAVLASAFAYTLAYDLIIVILTWARVMTTSSRAPAWRRLSSQGFLYFIFASVVNVPTMVFIWLDLNNLMNTMFSPPAICTSVILSSRLVLSLFDKDQRGSSCNRDDVDDLQVEGRPRKTFGPAENRTSEQFTTNIAFPNNMYEIGSSQVYGDHPLDEESVITDKSSINVYVSEAEYSAVQES